MGNDLVPIEMIHRKATTHTCWVYTQKGIEKSRERGIYDRSPGDPVPEYFRHKCPLWWVQNGWVEEAQGQLTLW